MDQIGSNSDRVILFCYSDRIGSNSKNMLNRVGSGLSESDPNRFGSKKLNSYPIHFFSDHIRSDRILMESGEPVGSNQ
jgi:hypothetical protein